MMAHIVKPLIPLFQDMTVWVQENSVKLQTYGTSLGKKMEGMKDWWKSSGKDGLENIVWGISIVAKALTKLSAWFISIFSNKGTGILAGIALILMKIYASLLSNAWRGAAMAAGKGEAPGSLLSRLLPVKTGGGAAPAPAKKMAQIGFGREGSGPGGRNPVTNRLNSFNSINWKNLIGVAAVIAALGGAIWILSKAFQNFADVEKNSGKALGAMMALMVGMMGVMWALSASGVGWQAALMLAALGASMLLMSYAFSLFANSLSSIPNGIGDTLLKLSGGIAALFLAFLGVGAAGALGLVMLAGMVATSAVLHGLGKWASSYAAPLSIAASAIETLANSFGLLRDSIDDIDVDKLGRLSNKLSANKANSVLQFVTDKIGSSNNSSAVNVAPVNTYVTVKIDSRKVADAMVAVSNGRV